MKIFVNGVHYHVETCGEGFPLVLLHGFTGDSSTWNPFCEEWSRNSRLIIPDLIGHGETESPMDVEAYKMEKAAADLRAILDHLGIERVDLLGYSMGGRLALTFAMLYPDCIRKLVLESSSPGLETEEERKLRCMKDADLAKFIMEQGMTAFTDYWENIPLFESMKELPADKQRQIRTQRLQNSQNGLANSLLGMGTGSQPSWWGSLGQLSCDVLILTGEKDEKFCRIAKQMMTAIKSASWVVIENSGHAIHVENPEKFGTIVSGFLK